LIAVDTLLSSFESIPLTDKALVIVNDLFFVVLDFVTDLFLMMKIKMVVILIL
jgi:hypothetical protein